MGRIAGQADDDALLAAWQREPHGCLFERRPGLLNASRRADTCVEFAAHVLMHEYLHNDRQVPHNPAGFATPSTARDFGMTTPYRFIPTSIAELLAYRVYESEAERYRNSPRFKMTIAYLITDDHQPTLGEKAILLSLASAVDFSFDHGEKAVEVLTDIMKLKSDMPVAVAIASAMADFPAETARTLDAWATEAGASDYDAFCTQLLARQTDDRYVPNMIAKAIVWVAAPLLLVGAIYALLKLIF